MKRFIFHCTFTHTSHNFKELDVYLGLADEAQESEAPVGLRWLCPLAVPCSLKHTSFGEDECQKIQASSEMFGGRHS